MNHLLIIGCGNMGGAMLAGWLAAGEPADRFSILDPSAITVPQGVAAYRNAADLPGTHDSVLLGFKPQQLPMLAPGLQPLTTKGVVVCSLLAGITLSQLARAFPHARAHIRVMPNLAAAIGQSPVALAHRGLSETEQEAAFRLFDRLGTALWLKGEEQFDLVTALAGSGPGFAYRFIAALAEAGAELGLDRAAAERLALTTVAGAANLAAQSEHSPAALADRVASPGGMTREGLDVLDRNRALVGLLTETLRATRDKGAALSAAAAEGAT